MKTMFVEARAEIKLVDSELDKLPIHIGLISVVQFMDSFGKLTELLIRKGKKVHLGKGEHTKFTGQVLGCDIKAAIDINDLVDAYLYVGTGQFHPKLVSLETDKPVFILDPNSGTVSEIDRTLADSLKKKRKAGLLSYYSAESIGILVSTKPGQNSMKLAIEFKEEIEKSGKKAYLFLSDTLDFNELENFNYIDVFVNTMCYRIGIDDNIRTQKPIVNYLDIKANK